MRFDLTDLRLFLNVHEAGSITGGASRSHMTLASASERIRSMEAELGGPLLTRTPRGVTLTDAGRTLVHHARLVLLQMDHLRGDLGDYGAGLRGHVRLLCNTAALSEHLPLALAGFLAKYPRISIDLEERPSEDIAQAVRQGLCDIGMVSDAVDLQGLEVFPFRPDPLVLIVPENHPLAQRPALALADIANLDFIGLADSALQEHLTRHARQLGSHLAYRVRLRSFDAICRMVGSGIGVAVIPKAAAQRHARATRIRRIPLTDAWAQRNLVLCVRRADELPGYARQMMRFVLGEAF